MRERERERERAGELERGGVRVKEIEGLGGDFISQDFF